MGNDTKEEICTSRLYYSHTEVDRSMCKDLYMMLDKVSYILPSIEAAQPGCKAGMEELCNLYNIVDKGKHIIRTCMECSSLYLAITCEATSIRWERIRNTLRRSLFLIQNMVEPLLANQVADIHNDLGGVKFIVDPAEEEAGKAILEMLRRSEATQELELQTFLLATSKLNLTSPKAILTERRAIKKLLDKISGTDPKKEAILKYFMYLVRKYRKDISLDNGPKKLNQNANAENGSLNTGLDFCGISNTGLDFSGISTQECFSSADSGNVRYEDQNNLSEGAIPSPELCCPMSLTLMHDPVIIATGQTYERDNIERWFDEGNDTCPTTQLKLQNLLITPNTCMKTVIRNWCRDQGLEYIYLPEKFQGYSVSSLNSVSAPLITQKNRAYMVDYSCSSFGLSGGSCASSPMREAEQSKSSLDLFNSNANCQLYLSFCNFDKTMFLGFFHDLSEHPEELQRKAVKDFKNVLNGENQIWQSMVSNGFLGAFFEFLKNDSGRYTVQALKAGIQFFLAFRSRGRRYHLDTGTCNKREHVAVILLAVCSCSVEYRSQVMKEGIIPALVDLLVNGTRDAKYCSSKLLRLLRDFKRCDQFSSSCSREVAANHVANNPPNGSICKQPISKSARYISRKLNIFSKPQSLTFV